MNYLTHPDFAEARAALAPLLQAYGLAVQPHPDVAQSGPFCSLELREIYVHESCEGLWHEQAVVDVLHEASHLITNPPGYDLHDVPEDFLLLQFERVVGYALLPKRYWKRMIGYQETQTECPLVVGEGMLLYESGGYSNSEAWGRGYQRAERVGLLTNLCRNLTMQRPNWDALTAEDRAILDMFRDVSPERKLFRSLLSCAKQQRDASLSSRAEST